MARTRVKICGITSVGDALLAAEAGADAVGLIFAPGSKRLISAAQAREISLALGPAVGRVGVFLGQETDEVLRLAEAARVSAVQLHGPLSDLELSQVAGYYPVLRVLRPQDLVSAAQLAWPPNVTLMLDAPQPGSGQPLDWAGLAPQVPGRIWLAGGLGPANVARAMRALRPAGVDAVSALELRPGVKDPAALLAFVAAVRQADENSPEPTGEVSSAGR